LRWFEEFFLGFWKKFAIGVVGMDFCVFL
jgi:hypothetical protein